MNVLKTVLSAGLGLGLSLSGVEVLAAEESRSKASKPSVMKNLFSFKDKKYRPNISFSGFYGQNDGSYGSLDMLYPIHQKNDRLVFVDLRGLLKKSPVKEVNVGGGYRWLSRDGKKLYGVHGFYDRKMSKNKNWFSQLTIGGELKTEQLKLLGLNTKGLSIGGNVYLPVGTKVGDVLDENLTAKAKPYQGDKFIIDFYGKEYAMAGMDLEVGHAIPNVKGLKGYLGGYYFSQSKVDESVVGPRATLTYDLSSLMPKKLTLIDHLELETSIQHDKPRGTTWYAGFRLQMQLGSSKDKPKLNGLEKQMTDFVRRDLDVVIDVGGETWTKETGAPYVGKIVSTEAELKALAQGKAKDVEEVDIIGVKGIIEVTGNEFDTAVNDGKNTKAGVRLNYGQSITGQGLTFTANDGKTYTVKIVNSDQSIAGADPSLVGDADRGGIRLLGANGKVGHLLQVYTKASATKADQPALEARVQRIEDLILTVPENSTGDDLTLGLTSSVITNLTGRVGTSGNLESFGHVVIDHINANSNVEMATLAGKTGKLRLTASKFTVSEARDGAAGMAIIVGVDKDGLVIESIDNNELVSMTSVGDASGLYFNYLNGPVVNNRFGSISSTATNAKAYGVVVKKDLSGNMSGNTFSSIVASGADFASGVYVNKNIESGGSVSGNTFSSIVGTDDIYGVYVEDGDLIGSVSGNTFSSITGNSARGVYVEDGDLIGSVSDNTFSSIQGEDDAYGVGVGDNLSGSVSNNTFSSITATDGDALGVYVDKNIESGGSVSGNTFSSIVGTEEAYGVNVVYDLSGSVSGNTFSSIVATDDAYGVYVDDNIKAGSSIANNVFKVRSVNGDAYGLGQNTINVDVGKTMYLTGIIGNTFKVTESGSRKNANGFGYDDIASGDITGTVADFKANNTFGVDIEEANKFKDVTP